MLVLIFLGLRTASDRILCVYGYWRRQRNEHGSESNMANNNSHNSHHNHAARNNHSRPAKVTDSTASLLDYSANQDSSRKIFVSVNGAVREILFSTGCSNGDLQRLLKQLAKVAARDEDDTIILLKTHDGAYVTIAPSLPVNTAAKPYSIQVVQRHRAGNTEEDRVRRLEASIRREMKMRNHLGDFEESMKSFVQHLQANWVLPADLGSQLMKRVALIEIAVEAEQERASKLKQLEQEISDLRSEMRSLDINKKFNLLTKYDEVGRVQVQKIEYDLLNYEKYTISNQTVDNLRQPSFDIWQWQSNEMLSLLEFMFNDLGLLEEFRLHSSTLKRWLYCVKAHYKANPFHNFRHCFCVAQMMYAMVHCCQLSSLMSRDRIGTLFVASICHDLDHCGFNNKYQIEARTELAVRYNDNSPLENHHCAVAEAILSQPETNILANLKEDRAQKILTGMRMLILATDMSRHKEILDDFRQQIQIGFDFSNPAHVDTICMILIKCCDISNEIRPQNLSEPWVDALLEEYFNQGDMERELGLEVDPLMDEKLTTKSRAQLKFIKNVILPMFEAVSQVLSQVRSAMIAPLIDALRRYERSSLEEEDETVDQ